MKKQFLFDVHLMASIRVPAETAEEARKLLLGTIDCADSNLGAWPNGDPIVCEVSVLGKGGGMEPAYVALVEEDEEENEHTAALLADWQYEVANGDTKRGFADWQAAKAEEAAHDNAELAGDYGLGDELADVSLLSEHEARALPGGLPPADCPSCGGKLGAYHLFGCPRANDPIADLAEIVSPNISDAIRTHRVIARATGPIMREVSQDVIAELKHAATDILIEIDSEVEQRQDSGNDEEWTALKAKSDRLTKALKAL